MDNQLAELKEKADALGIEYPKNIGVAKLETKINEANEASMAEREAKSKTKASKGGLPKGVKLTDQQIATAKAKEPIKVRIVNMNSNNSGATTVTAGVVNMYLNVQRVVPLGMDIALERCLINQIKQRTFSGAVPELDKLGDPTGNFIIKEQSEYQVVELP